MYMAKKAAPKPKPTNLLPLLLSLLFVSILLLLTILKDKQSNTQIPALKNTPTFRMKKATNSPATTPKSLITPTKTK